MRKQKLKKILTRFSKSFLTNYLMSKVVSFYSWFYLYGYCLLHITTPVSPFLLPPGSSFLYCLPAKGPPLKNVTAAILSYAVSHLHEGTGKRRKTCINTVGHSTESVPTVYSLWKNDLPLSILICRPWTGGHPSKYWPSAKLLYSCDCPVPDTYHTPNAFGFDVKSNKKAYRNIRIRLETQFNKIYDISLYTHKFQFLFISLFRRYFLYHKNHYVFKWMRKSITSGFPLVYCGTFIVHE